MVSATIDFSPTGGTQEIDQHQRLLLGSGLGDGSPVHGYGRRSAGTRGAFVDVLEFWD